LSTASRHPLLGSSLCTTPFYDLCRRKKSHEFAESTGRTERGFFSEEHSAPLGRLFGRRFGGFSANTVRGEPPWTGFWYPRGAQRPIIDRHMMYVVYSAQTPQAELFFQHLKAVLELPHVANQQVVLIEQVPVWLVQATPLPER